MVLLPEHLQAFSETTLKVLSHVVAKGFSLAVASTLLPLLYPRLSHHLCEAEVFYEVKTYFLQVVALVASSRSN